MRLRLDARLLDQLTRHMQGCLPEEGCGFLIGKGDTATRFVPAPNALESGSRFEVDPRFLFDLVRILRQSGEDMVGICHSHPRGSAHPSETDIRSSRYPAACHVIVSLASEEPEIRVWRIRGGEGAEQAEAVEAELHVNI